MTDKIASQMKVCYKLVSLRLSGCLFVVKQHTENYLRISFKCSHILYGFVAYHSTGKTLIANELNFSYVHVETVLSIQCAELLIQLHWHKL